MVTNRTLIVAIHNLPALGILAGAHTATTVQQVVGNA